MPEYNILETAGIPQRKKRVQPGGEITQTDRDIAARLDFHFYDGNRKFGYGGYQYDGRWQQVAKVIKERYNLNSESKVLIDRCHKGFLNYDLANLLPGITVYGLHPSEYPIIHAMQGYGNWYLKQNPQIINDPLNIELDACNKILPYLIKGDSRDMPFKDGFFDCVISIENVCAYGPNESDKVIREIMRINKNPKKSYIQNDSWENEDQKRKLIKWTKLCKTFLDIPGWEDLFRREGYDGDWGYTIIE